MESYKLKLRRRLIWWRVWWAICFILMLDQAGALTGSVRLDPTSTTIYNFLHALLFFVLAAIVLSKVPGKRKLLAKDLRKDRKNIYAKAMLLEIKVTAKRKVQAEEEERARVREKIKGMQEELGKVK